LFRFGKDNSYNQKFAPSIMEFDDEYEKKAVPGVLRFGKREIPGVLRFGRRSEDVPGVLRFGKRSEPGVLRFGRR
ncbi:unnamed protein product, partial [Onchocerca ochengi]